MNEILLSSDLTTITAEINSYKQLAGQSIWEIGRRLNHVKENDLAHGEFINWVNSLGMSEREAQRYMRVTNELPNTDTWSHLGNRALYLIATLPEEERTKEHITAKGDSKTVDEMTVREIDELKKELKRKEQRINYQADEIEKLHNTKPKVVEKVVEKIPNDYHSIKKEYEESKQNYEFYKNQNDDLRNEIKQLSEAIEKSQTEEEVKAKQDKLKELELKRLKREADINVYHTIVNIKTFVKEQAIGTYEIGAIANANDQVKKDLNESIKMLKAYVKDLEDSLLGQIIIGE